MSETRKRLPVRYLWSHQSPIHRAVMRIANRVLAAVPFQVKYGIGWRLRRNKLPYRLLEGATAVQIGAPYDTLRAGRSRAAYFGHAVGPEGTLLVIEPLPASAAAFEAFAADHLDCRTVVVNAAAWNETGSVELMVDRAHPATNFSGSTVDYSDERLSDFEPIEVASNTVDALVDQAGIGHPDLVSITTNWAEATILEGMGRILGDLRYVSLALGENDEDYLDLMASYGYTRVGFDDRGVTYERTTS